MQLSRVYRRCLPLAFTLFLGFSADKIRAQAPPKPNPQAPTVVALHPNGMQRGKAIEVVLTGNNLAGPAQVWTSFPAHVTIPTDGNNGKDNGRLRIRLEVAKDVPVGPGMIRLATRRGLSNFRLFCIDDLPQVVQTDATRVRATAPLLSVPCAVVGRTKPETRDYYKFHVTARQRLSFEVLGRRLGTPLDAQLTILDAATGREIAYCDDADGLQGDPRLTCTFAKSGDYLVELHDTLWRGGEGFAYRLRIGDFPCATTALPMAVRRGHKTTVHFAGPNVDGVPPVEVTTPADPAVSALWVVPRGRNGLAGWPVVAGVSDLDERLETEPNDQPAQANRLPVPGAITGRFLRKGDIDHYALTAKKGQTLHIRAWTQEYGSPSEIDLVVLNPQGGTVAELNPQAAPPADRQLDFTPPAEGTYVLAVSQLAQQFGPSESYRLTVQPAGPDFGLSVGISRFDVAQNGDATIPVQVARRGYAGPIELKVLGPPPVRGHGFIPAGQPAGSVELKAERSLPLGAYPITITGTATISGRPVTRYVSAAAAASRNLADLPFPPLPVVRQIAVAVTPKAPFTLTAQLERPELLGGSSANIVITSQRDAGFDEPITLSATGLPPNVTASLPAIGKGQTRVIGKLNVAANAPLGAFAVTVAGATKYQDLDLHTHTEPTKFVLSLPFMLRVEPMAVMLAPGGQAALHIHALRKAGYSGPIALEVRNLPPGVTAGKTSIPAGKDKIALDVQAAANAAVMKKTDVQVVGTATTAGNQQVISSKLTVTVAKRPAGK
ncbi:MAG TPA: PPC domain-containing protein [Gemmataceae bacterium]|nr:PPC domain-containing protein [Gemmataceae bacterium]